MAFEACPKLPDEFRFFPAPFMILCTLRLVNLGERLGQVDCWGGSGQVLGFICKGTGEKVEGAIGRGRGTGSSCKSSSNVTLGLMNIDGPSKAPNRRRVPGEKKSV